MNKSLVQSFSVPFTYQVHFTNSVFNSSNLLLRSIVEQEKKTETKKILFIVDQGVTKAFPTLISNIKYYFKVHHETVNLVSDPIIMPGGEASKNDPELVKSVIDAVNDFGIDRHSYIAVVGGGALIDMAGYAAAVAHRGIRLIRIPTTVLAQNDAAVGVKNSINAYGKKNFIGTFAPPFAVINDFDFLQTLDIRDWRSGISEAVKVALIKDKKFFESLKEDGPRLAARDMGAMEKLIIRCAEMHLQHIAGGDPFEMGSSRPLDFGHWAAHKLEHLTNFDIRHGEAVAIGIAMDSTYSFLTGRIKEEDLNSILSLLDQVGFTLYHEKLEAKEQDGNYSVIKGLNEFREHLGGRLTIMLLDKIGKGAEVHELDENKIIESINYLAKKALKLSF